MCYLYTKKLSCISHLLKVFEQRKQSMKFMLGHMQTFTISLNDDQKRFFRNFNAHAELNGM